MLFLLDTCALNHVRELQEHKIIDLRFILKKFQIGITNKVLEEWENYDLVNFYSPSNCYNFSIQNSDLEQMNKRFPFFRDFDDSDQSLLCVLIQSNSTIISDDGGLNAAALSINKKAIFLPDFCISLLKKDFLRKNEVRKMLTFWKKIHRYSLSDLKRWYKSINLVG